LLQIGRRTTSQALSRLDDRRRYPVLVCFCAEVLAQATDDAIDVFDKALGAADRTAQRKHDDRRRSQGRDTQDTIKRFIELGRLVLQARAENVDPWRLIDRRIGLERLEQDLARAERIARPTGDTHFDLLLAGGDAGRKMLIELTSALVIRSSSSVDERELLAALRLIVEELAGSNRRWLPGFVPTGFIDGRWRALIVDSARGRLDRRPYELCAAFELRTALRAGRVLPALAREPLDDVYNDNRGLTLVRERLRDGERPVCVR
jgi:hypothetical protein